MSEPSANLDALIAALEAAVQVGHAPSIAKHLAAIDEAMKGDNPLVRATTYAHVKSVTGKPLEAAEVLEDIIHLVDGNATLHYQIGCYRRQGQDVDGALAAFGRATDRDGSHVDAWMARGTLLDDRGEPGAAIEAYKRVVLLSPGEPDVWRNLGNSLAALTHFDQAIEAYRTGLSCAAGDETITFLLASAYQAKGDIERANATLPEALVQRWGRVEEVAVSRDGSTIACRFHVTGDRREATVDAVRRRLENLPVTTSGPVAIRIAEHPALLVPAPAGNTVDVLVCDVDPVREGLPNRFLDATTLAAALG